MKAAARRPYPHFAFVLAALAAVAAPSPGHVGMVACAWAAKADPGKALSDDAAVKFKDGKFLEAAELFERAFSLSPDKLVRLRNAGRAYEEAGKVEYAKLLFERYLQQAPAGPEKQEVAERVAAIDKRLATEKQAEADRQATALAADRAATAKAAPIAVAATADPQASIFYPWILLGSGAALLATGGGWLGYTQSKSSDIESAYLGGQYDYNGGTQKLVDDRSIIHRNQGIGWAAFGLGAAAAVGGGLWMLWPSTASGVVVLPYPTGNGAALALRF